MINICVYFRDSCSLASTLAAHSACVVWWWILFRSDKGWATGHTFSSSVHNCIYDHFSGFLCYVCCHYVVLSRRLLQLIIFKGSFETTNLYDRYWNILKNCLVWHSNKLMNCQLFIILFLFVYLCSLYIQLITISCCINK